MCRPVSGLRNGSTQRFSAVYVRKKRSESGVSCGLVVT
jgi:hypothetical protein